MPKVLIAISGRDKYGLLNESRKISPVPIRRDSWVEMFGGSMEKFSLVERDM